MRNCATLCNGLFVFKCTANQFLDFNRVAVRLLRDAHGQYLTYVAVVLTSVCPWMQPEMLNRERILIDEKSKNACEGHPDAATAGTGSGYGTTGNTGSATQAGHGSQATNANTGYGNNGSNY